MGASVGRLEGGPGHGKARPMLQRRQRAACPCRLSPGVVPGAAQAHSGGPTLLGSQLPRVQ